jgi:dienelactone hydrolase
MYLKPKHWPADGTAPAAIYCPALAGGAWNMTGWFMAEPLAKEGYLVACNDLGDTPLVAYGVGLNPSVGGSGNGGPGVWDSDAAMAKLDALYAKLMSSRFSARGPKIALMGGSHGGASSVRWAALNPDKVAALVLGIPVIDLQYQVNNPINPETKTSIQMALGMGSGTVIPAGHSGVNLAADLEMPVRCYHSTNDPYTPLASYTAFGAANPENIELISLGAVGHSLFTMDWTDAKNWLMGYIS